MNRAPTLCPLCSLWLNVFFPLVPISGPKVSDDDLWRQPLAPNQRLAPSHPWVEMSNTMPLGSRNLCSAFSGTCAVGP